MPAARPIEERFWEKVDRRGPDECWPWTASLDGKGYGQIGYAGRIRKAHQISWELQVGPLTPGLVIDHLCFNKACMNTTHMEEVQQGDNARRGRARRTPQRLKTHCVHGHKYTVENTRLLAGGRRACRECERRKAREWARADRARRRAEAVANGTYRPPNGGYVSPRSCS